MNNQIFFTVLSGTSVFVLGQILQRFIIEPFQGYKKTIGKIDNRLKFYSNILTSSGFNRKVIVEITDTVRNLSCDLESSYKQIPLNNLFSKMGVLETKSNIAEAATKLISVSNSGGRSGKRADRCSDEIEKIREILKIKSLS